MLKNESKSYKEDMFEGEDFVRECLESFDANVSLIEAGNTVLLRPNCSLRNTFSGDWGNGLDSVSYAKMLREECIEANRDVTTW